MKTSREASSTERKSRKETTNRLRKELRYMSAEHIIEDFGTKRDRKVIAAVMKWFSMNSTVAWRLKDGTYDCVWNREKDKVRDLNSSDAIVMTEKAWQRGKDVLE